MQSPTLENLATENKMILSSRRKFLTNLACGSLLFLAGTGVASARAKHFAARVAVNHKGKTAHATKSHEKLKSVISNRLAKKSEHRVHEKLVARHSLGKEQIVARHSRVHEQLSAHHLRGNKHGHAQRNHIELAAHKPQRSRIYRDDALVLDTSEERQYFARKIPSKMISLQNPHTGDRLRLTYFERGLYIEDALQEIDYVLRDYHTGDVHPIDPALLDQLYDLKLSLGVSRPFNIISGYRSPETNANLRRHSDGVAKHSLHMQGRAVDIRLEGYDVRTIRDAALSMQRGGVGYYSESNFIHLDTGDVRTWGA